MSEYKYPKINVTRKTGSEQFANANIKEQLIDYWAWAHSDICSNSERGKFAEYLVSLAMGCADGTTHEWGAYDIDSPEGIKIEVKSSAYLQTWAHKELSNITFSIRQSHAWNPETNLQETELKRQADIYVFCVENCQDQSLVNPFDLAQWDFYPVATNKLNEAFGSQKMVTLRMLEKKPGATICKFSELRNEILRQYHNN